MNTDDEADTEGNGEKQKGEVFRTAKKVGDLGVVPCTATLNRGTSNGVERMFVRLKVPKDWPITDVNGKTITFEMLGNYDTVVYFEPLDDTEPVHAPETKVNIALTK